MPVISKFYGITIKMYFRQAEHNPPHIHAISGDCIGVFSICDSEMLEGDLPHKGQQMVREFIEHYRGRLMQMWIEQDFELLPPVE